MRGLGAGAGRTKGRREGGLGLEKGLTKGQLEGGAEAPRRGASGVPSRAGPLEPPSLYNTVCYKTQNLLAGAADFLCLSAVSSLSGG